MTFRDHHRFTQYDITRVAEQAIAARVAIVLTTEKDAMRLRSVIDGSPLAALPLMVIAMRAVILNEPERFTALIRDHVATHPAHR